MLCGVMVLKPFIETLKEKKELIWKEYKSHLPGKSNATHPLDPVANYQAEDSYFWEMIMDYPIRQGKYVRGALVLLSCEAMGGKVSDAVKTAAAMQASEDWLLVHDDFEDGSAERRGKPALHKIYGDEQAVNAADALPAIMWKILYENEELLGHQKSARVMNEMQNIIMRTILGQSVEMNWTQKNKTDLNFQDIFFVVGGKTSYYTIAGPLRLGAILAGASPKQLETLFELGTVLGRCFQIRDDLLDLTSDFEGLKKQVGNDIYEGKRTIMLIHLLQQASTADKTKVIKILDKSREQKSEKEVKWIIEKMREYGSLEYSEKLAQDLANQSMKIFNEKCTFFKEGEAKEQLREAINFILTRKK